MLKLQKPNFLGREKFFFSNYKMKILKSFYVYLKKNKKFDFILQNNKIQNIPYSRLRHQHRLMMANHSNLN